MKAMRIYDLVLIIKSSLSQAQRKKLLESIKEWLKDVKVKEEKSWGQKPLSYQIRKEVSGFYHQMMLETEKILPLDFEKKLLAHEDVLRHLLIRRK